MQLYASLIIYANLLTICIPTKTYKTISQNTQSTNYLLIKSLIFNIVESFMRPKHPPLPQSPFKVP